MKERLIDALIQSRLRSPRWAMAIISCGDTRWYMPIQLQHWLIYAFLRNFPRTRWSSFTHQSSHIGIQCILWLRKWNHSNVIAVSESSMWRTNHHAIQKWPSEVTSKHITAVFWPRRWRCQPLTASVFVFARSKGLPSLYQSFVLQESSGCFSAVGLSERFRVPYKPRQDLPIRFVWRWSAKNKETQETWSITYINTKR